MSSGWICWRYENVGEFVPFLLKVGEIWHLNQLPFSKLSFSPMSFSRFTHLHISPICIFCFYPLLPPVSSTCRLLVNIVFIHFFFPFHPHADLPTCRFLFHFPVSPTCRFHLRQLLAVLTIISGSNRHAETYGQSHTHTHVIIMRNGCAAARSVKGQHATRTQ